MTRLETIQELPPWDWPSDARQIFLKALADPNTPPPDRVIAARLAGDMVVIDADIAQLLAGIAADAGEPEELRAKAAISLGPILEHTSITEFDDPDDIVVSPAIYQHLRDSLHELYRDTAAPKLVRRRALEAAVRAPDDWQKKAIAEDYESRDREWVVTAVFCMQFVPGFERQIVEALDDPDPDIHRHAVQAAANFEVEGAFPHIRNLLRSEPADKDLLLAAIEATGSLRPNDAFELLESFIDSEDEDIAEAVQEAIGMADALGEDFGEAEEEFEDEDEEESGWSN
jgi:predicted nucleic acid-binding protein